MGQGRHRTRLGCCTEHHQPAERPSEGPEDRSDAGPPPEAADHPPDDRAGATPKRQPNHVFRLRSASPAVVDLFPMPVRTNHLGACADMAGGARRAAATTVPRATLSDAPGITFGRVWSSLGLG